MLYDYYKILEISRTASFQEIKLAYRTKAKMFHPDINNSPKANEIFAVINEAYEVLTNEKKRYLHDIKLNYADSIQKDAERKKQYYGSSAKNDSYTNTANFHYNWNNFSNRSYKEKTDQDYYKRSPWIYNLFFASGMFVGFLIIIITITGTYNNYWPTPFILISIPGIILVREGWKGMIGKKNLYNQLIKKFKN